MLSLDTELAWGSAHGGKYADRKGLFEKTRPCISRLLGLLEKYQVHATWAVVGHLFLDRCAQSNGLKHPDIIRPKYAWFPGDWLGPDPCACLETAPDWYGADIVKQIIDCKVSQEIGCHTFSHIHVGDPGCSSDCFASDLEACRGLARKFDIALKSFVFPRNGEDHWDVLTEHNFTSYRGSLPPHFRNLPPILRELAYRFSPGPTCLPEKKMGLWNLAGCMFYPPSRGMTWSGAMALQVWRAKKGIRNAAERRRLFHLWFHPFNLAIDPDALLGGLEQVFSEVNHLREAGRLDNLTMGEMADRLNSNDGAKKTAP